MDQGNTTGNPTFQNNQYEHAMVYTRSDGKRVEVAFMQLPNKTVLQAAVFNASEDEPVSISPKYTLEEAKYRHEFYSRLHDAGLI